MIKKYDYLICLESLYNSSGVCMYFAGKKYQFYGISTNNNYYMVPEKLTCQFKYHQISEFSFENYFCSAREYRKRKIKNINEKFYNKM